MRKELIIKELKDKVDDELVKVKQAYETTKNLVQAGDLKSDGKYDTRATEANYLADGQRQRITELEHEVELLDSIPKNKKTKDISIGSLVEIELNKQRRLYYISPTAGGTLLSIESNPILVISVFSPIGDAALGHKAGESFELEFKEELREYSVISVS